ncbi:NAD(P)/FAD-dependent oxidoreductase [Nitratiruptor tergarcus]|uniref:Flavoprotein, HI0933 family n=1 Tax=Nitratiruptor tergarcus DSM 16512 TaxID=1069081 RepID=A0A1W1WU90_9BACT|nr:aminoacetone oxidase family FAD-binding enzyme [Nitratiruptor tergarcus]SMC09881.1 hypothetical protein SAMN05660197_1703 [Nitratiruptor tergarcus DSM 16512]
MKDLIILGAGASGLFCAQFLRTKNYLLLEHNPKPARKIAISGGGRCNVTNKIVNSSHYLTKYPQFVENVFTQFDNRSLLQWLKKKRCEPVLRKKTQYFCPHSAYELIEILANRNTLYNCEIKDVEYKKGIFVVKTSQGVFRTRSLLVATGGLSYKKIGASGIGYEIAKKFGHTVTPLAPALVGLTVQKEQFWFKKLSGVTLPAVVRVGEKQFCDNILFTHKGISGPAILNASLYWQKGYITLSFLPQLPKFLPYKNIATQLPLPKRFTIEFFHAVGIKDKKAKDLTVQEKKKLQLLRAYSFAPAGTFGYERAEVTKGGVDIGELDERMQSKIIPGLFFAGEVCDVTGELGGYNFQWAFSSAFVAQRGIDEYLRDH